MTSRLQTGTYVLQIAILDEDDYPMGVLVTPNAPVNGTVYSPLVVPALVEYTAGSDTVESVESFATQKARGKRDLGTSSLGDGTLTLSEFDDVFDALVQGYALDTSTATALRISGHNVNRTTARRFMLGFTAAATPSNSAQMYDTIWTWGTLRRGSLGSNQGTGRNPNNRTYTLTKFMSSRTPWGQLYSAATIAPNGNRDDEVVMYASAPISLSTYVDDNTATTYLLPYAPDSTEHAGATNIFFEEGATAHAAVSGISGSTVTITASTAGDRWVNMVPSSALLNVS